MEVFTAQPQFVHDSDCCTFLSHVHSDEWADEHWHADYDLYWCNQGGMPTVIARYGDDGPEYTSGIAIAETGLCPPLAIALELANRADLPCDWPAAAAETA